MIARSFGSRKNGTCGAPGDRAIALPRQGDPRSANWRRVLNAPLGPQRVEAARDPQRRTLADIAVEHLAVIAHQLDDAIDPVLAEPEPLAEIILGAEQALDLGILRFHLLVDIG